jgi:hypothetical protein
MQTQQHSIISVILALLVLAFAASSLDAQSPQLAQDYKMPEELANLQSQYRSIPDCVYEYVVHLYPAKNEEFAHRRYRFMTARGMWRYERLDENGLVAEKVYFDGKVFYHYMKRSDMLLILPNPPLPCSEGGCEGYRHLASSHFSVNPLFTVLSMPFRARPTEFKIPDIHAPQLWTDVMRRSATRHRPSPGTPANQVHFLFDDEALNGILKLEKLDSPGQPAWRVVEHNYLTRSSSAHVVTRYEGWMRFPLGEGEDAGAVLHMPLTTTITTKVVPQSTVVTIELLPNTVMKAPSKLSADDFRVPRSIVTLPTSVYDLTTQPDKGVSTETARTTKPVKPSSTSGQRPDKLGDTELKPAPKLKPSPGLKPAPKL